jgi:hypothetical protein
MEEITPPARKGKDVDNRFSQVVAVPFDLFDEMDDDEFEYDGPVGRPTVLPVRNASNVHDLENEVSFTRKLQPKTTHHKTPQYNRTQHTTIQHNTTHHNTIRHNTTKHTLRWTTTGSTMQARLHSC